jgi:hypothetical protein
MARPPDPERYPCGTDAAAQRHRRRGERPCAACLAAQAKKKRDRLSDPDIRADNARRNGARSRALWRLAKEYPERFKALFVEEVTRQ